MRNVVLSAAMLLLVGTAQATVIMEEGFDALNDGNLAQGGWYIDDVAIR